MRSIANFGAQMMAMLLFGLIVLLEPLSASEHHGQVTFNTLPVPGASITAVQNGKSFVAITDQQGSYSFPDLADGTCTIEIRCSVSPPKSKRSKSRRMLPC